MLKVNVIGIGPGNPDLLTEEARKAIAESTILAGDKRMVGQFGSGKKVCPTIKLAELAEVAANADRHSGFRRRGFFQSGQNHCRQTASM